MRLRSTLALAASLLFGQLAPAAGWDRIDWRTVPAARVKELLAGTPRKDQEHIPLSRRNDPGRRFPPGETSALLLAACYSPHPGVVQTLLEAGGRATDTGPGAPLLFAARFNPEPGIIRVLVAHGAAVGANLGFPILARPALTYAAQSNPSPAVIDALVAAGAAVNAKVSVLDNMGFTPLMYAAQSNPNPAVVRALVRAGAKPGITDAMDRTALVLAAQYNGNPGVLAALIAGGAEVNLVCRDYANIGWTPLMYAAASGEGPLPKVALLLAAGADARARSRDGGTALDRAAANPAVDRRSPVYRALARASR